MSISRPRWQVLAAGIFSLMLAMGVARFAYTPLLPLMQAQAGLGVAEGGWLAAINYAGYLSGALLAALISDLHLKDRLYRLGMVLAVLSTLMMGLTSDPLGWMVSRFVAGLSSAAAMLLGTGLILNWLLRHDHRPELGIHFAGIGLGIAGCSALIWWLGGQFDWRELWFGFAAVASVLLVPALAWLPAPESVAVSRRGQTLADNPPPPLFMRLFMAAYFCAGVGYVVSATFIVAIVERLPGLAGQGILVFLVLGLAAAPACIVWDLVARRTGELTALILAAALQVIGILAPLGAESLEAALVGAALFGSTFIGMVSLVLTMAGRYYPTRPAKMMGRMTLAYGTAQIIGPALTGWLAVRWGGYDSGLYLAAAAMGVGVLLLAILRGLDARQRRSALTPCLEGTQA